VQLTHEDVREILRLLDESPYDELKIETEGFSLTLKRTCDTNRTQQIGQAHRSDRMTGTKNG
jgi:hypothetical protein